MHDTLDHLTCKPFPSQTNCKISWIPITTPLQTKEADHSAASNPPPMIAVVLMAYTKQRRGTKKSCNGHVAPWPTVSLLPWYSYEMGITGYYYNRRFRARKVSGSSQQQLGWQQVRLQMRIFTSQMSMFRVGKSLRIISTYRRQMARRDEMTRRMIRLCGWVNVAIRSSSSNHNNGSPNSNRLEISRCRSLIGMTVCNCKQTESSCALWRNSAFSIAFRITGAISDITRHYLILFLWSKLSASNVSGWSQ